MPQGCRWISVINSIDGTYSRSILLLHLYSILASEINSRAKKSIHSSNKTSRYKSKPHSVALLVMTCWCKDWCAICALIMDIAYAYWNKDSHAQNHAHPCNRPQWKDSRCSLHTDDSKLKTFFASGSLTHIVPCFHLPVDTYPRRWFWLPRDSCDSSICYSSRWQNTRTGTTLHNSCPDSMGSPEEQRVWTTLHFTEFKVPHQLWHLSRVSTGRNLNSAQVINTLFAPQRLALHFRNSWQLVKDYKLLSVCSPAN